VVDGVVHADGHVDDGRELEDAAEVDHLYQALARQ
jgi:hypothetical protein